MRVLSENYHIGPLGHNFPAPSRRQLHPHGRGRPLDHSRPHGFSPAGADLDSTHHRAIQQRVESTSTRAGGEQRTAAAAAAVAAASHPSLASPVGRDIEVDCALVRDFAPT